MSEVNGCLVLGYDKKEDARGSFSRVYCDSDLRRGRKHFECKQVSIAYNEKANTVRGLHFQGVPDGENKIVTCLTGRSIVFVLDARKGSPTYKNVLSMELRGDGKTLMSLYIPKYCASGYAALTDGCSMLYHVDKFYDESIQTGFNITDKSLGIEYDFSASIISDRDRGLPMFSEAGGI